MTSLAFLSAALWSNVGVLSFGRESQNAQRSLGMGCNFGSFDFLSITAPGVHTTDATRTQIRKFDRKLIWNTFIPQKWNCQSVVHTKKLYCTDPNTNSMKTFFCDFQMCWGNQRSSFQSFEVVVTSCDNTLGVLPAPCSICTISGGFVFGTSKTCQRKLLDNLDRTKTW